MATSLDMQSAASSSTSFAVSTPPTSIINSNSNISQLYSVQPRRHASAVGLMDLFSKDLPSFFRSSSKLRCDSSKLSPQVEESQVQKIALLDYAQHSPRDQTDLELQHMQMFRERDNEKATSRSESKFYGFLRRSSSHSRSKKRRSRSADALPVAAVSPLGAPSSSLHARHSSWGHVQNNPEQPSSKPAALSPSRPLSSTTTATNGTITQAKVRTKRSPRLDTPPSHAPEVPPPPDTPEQSKPRKKTIFGIPIPNPGRPSFSRSRPHTPKDHNQLWKIHRVFSAPSHVPDIDVPMNGSTNSTDDAHLQHSIDISEPDSGLGLETFFTHKPKVVAPQARPLALTNLEDVPRCVSSSPPGFERHAVPSTVKPRHAKPEPASGRSSPLVGFFRRDKGKERESSSTIASPIVIEGDVGRESRSTGRATASISGPKVAKGRIKHGSFDFERPISSTVGSRGGLRSGPSSRTPSGSETGKTTSNGPWRGHSTTYVIPEERSSLTRSRSTRSSSAPQEGGTRIRFEDSHFPRSNPRTNGNPHSHARLPSLPVATGDFSQKSVLPPLPLRTDATPTGTSSSWGRSTTKRATTASGTGAHPAFPFEPVIPPKKDKFGLGRTAGKGRSLDLGIDLNWAPTRVKEEAVMSLGKTKAKWREEAEIKDIGRSKVAESFEQVLGENGYAKFREYIHRFDARLIPLDGPSGLLYKVQRLLDTTARGLDEQRKRELLEKFDHVVQQNR